MLFKEYLLQNWPLVLVLLAFIVALATTVFLQKKIVVRTYVLIAFIFILSIIVFLEFYFSGKVEYKSIRLVLTAIRYSATPIIIAQVIVTLVKRMKWYFIFIPSFLLTILNFISIPTGIVFSLNDECKMVHGVLWILPYIVVGLYSVLLIYLLIKRSNKSRMEIIPIIFLSFALGSGLVLPFIFKEAYAPLFCVTIAIAVFAYYEFSILLLTKKDSLTGLLNRHAYFADISHDPKNITALVSIDMNGLKFINDNISHLAGDEALVTVSLCFKNALRGRQTGYRIGGDEFIIVCRKSSEEEVVQLVERIKKNVGETKYRCAIGYSVNLNGDKPISELLKESDKMMYQEKKKYYQEIGINKDDKGAI